MKTHEELFVLSRTLSEAADLGVSEEVKNPLAAVEQAAKEIGRSSSGSWLGYHSRVYYVDLAPAPPGANFSSEWGLKSLLSDMGSTGDWRQYAPEHVKETIFALARKPDLSAAQIASEKADKAFNSAKSEIESIFESEIDKADGFLTRIRDELQKLTTMSASDVRQVWRPKGQIMTRDALALSQGFWVPPHIEVLSEIMALGHSFEVCRTASELCKKAASHLERTNRRAKSEDRVGTNVFIGHGRSGVWRELKDFVKDRLQLPWDEFNRVPVAGVTNIARLAEMLDAAAIAFLVMTAEDELADGELQARMNVVHEAGMFQGRLGFTKAIVLLEDGCKEFTNIQGLGQLRFPKGNISAVFEDVRRVLEREGLLSAALSDCG
jgi:hypothetical protein